MSFDMYVSSCKVFHLNADTVCLAVASFNGQVINIRPLEARE